MSLETTSLAQLDSFFKEFFHQDCFEALYERLSTELRVNPKQEQEIPFAVEGIKFPLEMTMQEKFLLLTSTWYFRENPISFLLLLECKRLFGKEFENEYSVLCSSKTLALGFWLSQTKWNDRDFYGNVTRLRRKGNFLRLIKIQTERDTSKVKRYTGYCRGYSESGRFLPYRSKSVKKERFLTERQGEQKKLLQLLRLQLLIRRIKERLRLELK